MRLLLAMLLLISTSAVTARAAGLVRGNITSAATNQPLASVRVQIQGTRLGALTDERGNFTIADVAPGPCNLEVSLLGYRRRVLYEIDVTAGRPVSLDIALEEEVVGSDSVSVTASPFRRPAESPVSLQNIGANEIERFPGGDRDISKVVQSMPGVAGTPSFRNDVVIRGGAPNENRFFIDGVEVPVINHFATQGSSGGPVGMIDVNFIQDVDLLTSAFPANRGNALSSVMEFRMKNGNDDRLSRSVTVGASDFGATVDGPVGSPGRLVFSVRRSYLQYVASAIGLPFLPTYNDAQLRFHWHPSGENQFTVIALGAVDQFKLNTRVNNTEFQRYVLDNLPETPQWNYTTGAVWKHLDESGVRTLLVSSSQLDNRATKYFHNDRSNPSNLLLDYRSQEIQDRFRAEWTRYAGTWRLNWGGGADHQRYTTSTYQKIVAPEQVLLVDFESNLVLTTGDAFGQASRSFSHDRLSASLGLRIDIADYSRLTRAPLQQLSPRLSGSWRAAPGFRVSASVARYFQLPPYTVLGFRDSVGALANRDAGVRWIRADHFVAGVEYLTRTNSRLTAEAFLKRYANYPYLTRDLVSLANLGADFGVIGNSPASARSRGRAWGFEVLAQQRLYHAWYGIAAYTYVRSEFTNRADAYRPSSWDNRHVVSLTGGHRLPRGWEVGGRWRLLGGAPYTPDDVERSSLRSIWDVTGRGVSDTRLLNTRRNGVLHQLDTRIDKRWSFRGSSLDAYLDVQNVYAFTPQLQPTLTVERDPVTGAPLVDSQDPTRYLTKVLKADPSTPLPTIGLRVTF
jgi:hypothetical protein